jgi:hypothetical protein
MSRRSLLEAGAGALAGGAGLLGAAKAHAAEGRRAGMGPSKANEDVIRKYYAGWEKKEWGALDILLADNFTFTSANDDDHISKSAFKARSGSRRLISSSGSTWRKCSEKATRRS